MKQEPIKFYILISTYNRPNRALRALKSILQQDYQNYQILIYNDGSSEDYSTFETYLQNHPKIRYSKNTHNKGANASKNILLAQMADYPLGEKDYYFILDDDDYLTENALQTISTQIQKYPENLWFGFDVKSKSIERSDNPSAQFYKEYTYAQYRQLEETDYHFIMKRPMAESYQFATKYFKNGYEHLYYFQLPSKILLLPEKVKTIQYYPDGLSQSGECNLTTSLRNATAHILLHPKQKIYYYWLFKAIGRTLEKALYKAPKRLYKKLRQKHNPKT